jgi:hypothetical protein
MIYTNAASTSGSDSFARWQYRSDNGEITSAHSDSSDITINLCLGRTFTGSQLMFHSPPPTTSSSTTTTTTTSANITVEQKAGEAVVHLGEHIHDVAPIVTGERYNLVLWINATRTTTPSSSSSKPAIVSVPLPTGGVSASVASDPRSSMLIAMGFPSDRVTLSCTATHGRPLQSALDWFKANPATTTITPTTSTPIAAIPTTIDDRHAQLVTMGFPSSDATRACLATKGQGLQSALDWFLSSSCGSGKSTSSIDTKTSPGPLSLTMTPSLSSIASSDPRVIQLLEMSFPRVVVIKACLETSGQSLQSALDWFLQHHSEVETERQREKARATAAATQLQHGNNRVIEVKSQYSSLTGTKPELKLIFTVLRHAAISSILPYLSDIHDRATMTRVCREWQQLCNNKPNWSHLSLLGVHHVIADRVGTIITRYSSEYVRYLDVSFCNRIAPKALNNIVEHCPSVESLSMIGISNWSLLEDCLPKLVRLRSFNISGVNRSRILEKLVARVLPTCTRLERLDISGGVDHGTLPPSSLLFHSSHIIHSHYFTVSFIHPEDVMILI